MEINMNNFLEQTRASNVNIINNKTINNGQLTSNTTCAAEAAEKVVIPIVTSSPLASPSEKTVLANLEKEVVMRRDEREKIHRKKNADFIADTDEKRKQMQFAKERDAKYTVQNAHNIFRIEATVHKKSNKINIDVLQDPGGRFARYTSNMQCNRARDLLRNIPTRYHTWWGYDIAKEAIDSGIPAGKIRLRQNQKGHTRIAPKIIPATVALLDGRNLRLIIGDSEYAIYLQDYDTEFYLAKGIYQREETECVDIGDIL